MTIVHFRKSYTNKDGKFKTRHLATRNVNSVPEKGSDIVIEGLVYLASRVVFNVDTSEYTIFVKTKHDQISRE